MVAKAILVPLLVAGVLTILGELTRGWFYLNITHSMSRGIYVETAKRTFSKGDLVILPVPKSMEELKKSRSWLSPVRSLLKIVVGTTGDSFCFNKEKLEIGGEIYPVSKEDHEGKKLPIQEGCKFVGEGEVFVMGKSSDSFDSRYFGAVRVEDVEKVVEPFLVF